MDIRPITPADIPALLAMGGLMHDESEYRVLDYAPEKCAALCRDIMAHPDAELGLVAVEGEEYLGMFGAYIQSAFFCDELIAQEYLVYVRPEHRGSWAFLRLMRAYRNWARKKGARLIFVRPTAGIDTEEVEALYTKLGFVRAGGVFSMEV